MFDIFVHHRRSSTHHPAVLRTFAHHITYLLCLFTFPNSHKVRSFTNITHFLHPVFFLQTITWIYITIRFNKEIGRTSFTWQHTATSFYIVNQPHIEESTKPTFRMILFQLPFYQLFKVFADFIFVCYHIIVFMKII